MIINLEVDDREKKLFNVLDYEFSKPKICANSDNVFKEVKRLDIGDYIIKSGEQILAIIERKSLKDYGASIKDGRHNNKSNLLNLRNEIGCQVYYIIEGPQNPEPDTEYAGIKYKNINASINNLMIRDKIFIIKTVDIKQTAYQLKFICESFSKLTQEEIFGSSESRYLKYGDANEAIKKAKPSEKENENIINIWKAIPGIGQGTAFILAKNTTIKSWLYNEIDIDSFQLERKLPSNIITLLTTPVSKDNKIRIMSNIKGIKKDTAETFLSIYDINDIILGRNVIIAGKNLGKIRRNKIIKILTSKVNNI